MRIDGTGDVTKVKDQRTERRRKVAQEFNGVRTERRMRV